MRKLLEKDVQIAVVSWMKIQHPKIVCMHIPNESKIPIQYRVQLKKMGLYPGVSDLFIPKPNNNYHGMWLEIKRDNKSKPTSKQIAFLTEMLSEGYYGFIGHGFDECQRAINHYLRG